MFANGSINNVNYRTHPDLFFALRGGGNNFGIVTRFDMAAFPQGDLWAGQRLYTLNPTVEKSLNDAFYWLTINGPSDLSAAAILAYVYVPYFPGSFYVASDLEYSQPIVEPLVFKNFSDIAKANQQVLVSDSMRITNVTHLTYEFNSSNPSGFRYSLITLSAHQTDFLQANNVDSDDPELWYFDERHQHDLEARSGRYQKHPRCCWDGRISTYHHCDKFSLPPKRGQCLGF